MVRIGRDRRMSASGMSPAGAVFGGATQLSIDPPLPVDMLGFVRRDRSAREHGTPLLVTALVLRSDDAAAVIAAADLAGMTPAFAARVREAIAGAVGCRPEDVLLNSSHTHAAPWPGAAYKLGGEVDDWTATELAYWDWLPHAFATAALRAAESAVPIVVSGGTGRAPGIAVNRRERTSDGRTILGWNPEGFLDEEVPAIRIDAASDGHAVATIVGFGCHPVVVGPDVAKTGSDFAGPLRERVEALRGGVCLFLQGAAGNVLPLEAFHEHEGPEVPFGERLGLEAAHAIADADPRTMVVERLGWGSVTPISLYRRRALPEQPAPALAVARRVVPFPLLEIPTAAALEHELAERRADLEARRQAGESRVTMNPIRYHIAWLQRTLAAVREGRAAPASDGEIWAVRIGETAIVAAPGEIFSEIGAAVRHASPAQTTIFAGYANGVLGYVATPEEYPFGGYEPAVAHRGYDHPAPFSPEVAGIIERTAGELLRELFPTTAATTATAARRAAR